MDRFMQERNLSRYRQLADQATTADEKKKLLAMLAQEQAQMKRELKDLIKRLQSHQR